MRCRGLPRFAEPGSADISLPTSTPPYSHMRLTDLRFRMQDEMFGYLHGHAPRYFLDHASGGLVQKIRQAGNAAQVMIDYLCGNGVRHQHHVRRHDCDDRQSGARPCLRPSWPSSLYSRQSPCSRRNACGISPKSRPRPPPKPWPAWSIPSPIGTLFAVSPARRTSARRCIPLPPPNAAPNSSFACRSRPCAFHCTA